ncbi:unnamed protein product [Moneuplotes crassus]|uniref:CCHC-type domain-containing protein n=1 Tax=Euplotes crassus TaxID=5936 RepID=A0AAD1XP44_EUPCR|nr:unnamed protein product [Moneuplotes crassus]
MNATKKRDTLAKISGSGLGQPVKEIQKPFQNPESDSEEGEVKDLIENNNLNKSTNSSEMIHSKGLIEHKDSKDTMLQKSDYIFWGDSKASYSSNFSDNNKEVSEEYNEESFTFSDWKHNKGVFAPKVANPKTLKEILPKILCHLCGKRGHLSEKCSEIQPHEIYTQLVDKKHKFQVLSRLESDPEFLQASKTVTCYVCREKGHFPVLCKKVHQERNLQKLMRFEWSSNLKGIRRRYNKIVESHISRLNLMELPCCSPVWMDMFEAVYKFHLRMRFGSGLMDDDEVGRRPENLS